MIKDFFDGITAYGAALRHISQYRLWGYVLVPGILCVLVGLGIFGLAWGLADNIGDLIDNIWPWEWGKSIVEKIADVFGGLLVALLGLIVFKQIILVVTAPVMSLLSEKVEDQIMGNDRAGRGMSVGQIISDISRGLRIALRNIVREILLSIVLLVLGLIPLFSPFSAVLLFLLQAYYAGFGNLDFALERHFRFRGSVEFVHRHRGLAMGNGVVFIALLLTFVGFLFVLPLSTVAATIETVKRVKPAVE